MNTYFITDTFTATFTDTVTKIIDDCYEDLAGRFTTARIRRSPASVGVDGDGPALTITIELHGDRYIPTIYLRQAWCSSASSVALDETLLEVEKQRARENLSAVGLAELWLERFGGMWWLRADCHDPVKVAAVEQRRAAEQQLTEARSQCDTESKRSVLQRVLAGEKLSSYEGALARSMKLLVVTEGKSRKLTALGYQVLGVQPPAEAALPEHAPEVKPEAASAPEVEPEPTPEVEPAAEVVVEPEPAVEPEPELAPKRRSRARRQAA